MAAYNNPTNVNYGNPTFGSSSQFNIPGNQKPFDFMQQKQEGQDYTAGLTSFIPQQRSQVEGSLGLPQLRENYIRGNQMLNNLQSRMFNVPNTVRDTTRESLLNEGQRARMVESQEAPMRRDLGMLQGQQGNLGSALGVYENVSQQQQQQGMLPWEKQYDQMTQRQAREFTGWSEANSNELNRLINNQKSGLQWTNDEAQRANQLAVAEKQYQSALEQQRLKNDAEYNMLGYKAKYGLKGY